MPLSWRDLFAVADKGLPGFRQAFLKAVAAAQAGVSTGTIRTYIAKQQYDKAEAYVEQIFADAADGWRVQLSQDALKILGDAGALTTSVEQLGGAFDLLNPRAIAWANAESSTLVKYVTEQQKAAIRAVIGKTVGGEFTPVSAARQLRSIVGLDPRRAAALANFQARTDAATSALLAAKPKWAAAKVAAVQAKAQRKVDRYAAKLLKSRTETIARTETMASANEGMLEAWRQARDAGKISRNLVKRWITTPDDRRCTVICKPMHGRMAPLDVAFVVPKVGAVQRPPAHPNCRCVLSLVRAPKTGKNVEGGLPPPPPPPKAKKLKLKPLPAAPLPTIGPPPSLDSQYGPPLRKSDAATFDEMKRPTDVADLLQPTDLSPDDLTPLELDIKNWLADPEKFLKMEFTPGVEQAIVQMVAQSKLSWDEANLVQKYADNLALKKAVAEHTAVLDAVESAASGLEGQLLWTETLAKFAETPWTTEQLKYMATLVEQDAFSGATDIAAKKRLLLKRALKTNGIEPPPVKSLDLIDDTLELLAPSDPKVAAFLAGEPPPPAAFTIKGPYKSLKTAKQAINHAPPGSPMKGGIIAPLTDDAGVTVGYEIHIPTGAAPMPAPLPVASPQAVIVPKPVVTASPVAPAPPTWTVYASSYSKADALDILKSTSPKAKLEWTEGQWHVLVPDGPVPVGPHVFYESGSEFGAKNVAKWVKAQPMYKGSTVTVEFFVKEIGGEKKNWSRVVIKDEAAKKVAKKEKAAATKALKAQAQAQGTTGAKVGAYSYEDEAKTKLQEIGHGNGWIEWNPATTKYEVFQTVPGGPKPKLVAEFWSEGITKDKVEELGGDAYYLLNVDSGKYEIWTPPAVGGAPAATPSGLTPLKPFATKAEAISKYPALWDATLDEGLILINAEKDDLVAVLAFGKLPKLTPFEQEVFDKYAKKIKKMYPTLGQPVAAPVTPVVSAGASPAPSLGGLVSVKTPTMLPVGKMDALWSDAKALVYDELYMKDFTEDEVQGLIYLWQMKKADYPTTTTKLKNVLVAKYEFKANAGTFKMPAGLPTTTAGPTFPPGAVAPKVVASWKPTTEWVDDLMSRKIAAATGTNPGGVFADASGAKYYVKIYGETDQGIGEALASRIYRELGLTAPETAMATTSNGQVVFISKMLDDVKGTLGELGVTAPRANKVLDGFVADVFTANWDTIGAGTEKPLGNILILGNGSVARVDQGGALLYRGLTGKKPDAVLNQITEWEKFFTSNPSYSKVAQAAGINAAEDLGPRLVAQIDRVLALVPDYTSRQAWIRYVDERIYSGARGVVRERIAEMLHARAVLLGRKRDEIQAALKAVSAPRTATGARTGWMIADSTVRESTEKTARRLSTRELTACERLSTGQRSAVEIFTASGYDEINNAARTISTGGATSRLSATTVSHCKKLDEILTTAPTLDAPTVVWRGTPIRDNKVVEEAIAEWRAGRTGVFHFRAYSSTSTSADFAWNWRQCGAQARPGNNYYLFEIETEHGMYVDPISRNRGEKELILPRSVRLEVVGEKLVKVRANGRLNDTWVTQVRVVGVER
jgi:hypothetical protein